MRVSSFGASMSWPVSLAASSIAMLPLPSPTSCWLERRAIALPPSPKLWRLVQESSRRLPDIIRAFSRWSRIILMAAILVKGSIPPSSMMPTKAAISWVTEYDETTRARLRPSIVKNSRVDSPCVSTSWVSVGTVSTSVVVIVSGSVILVRHSLLH